MSELNPLLRALEAFDKADVNDAEYALRLATRIVQLKREAKAVRQIGSNVVARPPASDSVVSRVEAVLSDIGKPMTADQIADKVNSRFGVATNKASIASALSRSIRVSGSPFARQSTGVFVLRAWNADGDGAEEMR